MVFAIGFMMGWPQMVTGICGILLARLLDERSFIELSKNLGVSYKAVSNSYYRLILKLRRMMKGDAMDD